MKKYVVDHIAIGPGVFAYRLLEKEAVWRWLRINHNDFVVILPSSKIARVAFEYFGINTTETVPELQLDPWDEALVLRPLCSSPKFVSSNCEFGLLTRVA
jgi:hypothetical protein